MNLPVHGMESPTVTFIILHALAIGDVKLQLTNDLSDFGILGEQNSQ